MAEQSQDYPRRAPAISAQIITNQQRMRDLQLLADTPEQAERLLVELQHEALELGEELRQSLLKYGVVQR